MLTTRMIAVAATALGIASATAAQAEAWSEGAYGVKFNEPAVQSSGRTTAELYPARVALGNLPSPAETGAWGSVQIARITNFGRGVAASDTAGMAAGR